MEHASGRIRYEYEPGYCGELISSNGTTIATFNDEPIEPNARRMVACWNACEGISTESLESAGNAFNGWKLASYAMNDAKSQRDDLLQALKKMLDAFYHDPLGGGQDAAIEAALGAVAKAEGEK